MITITLKVSQKSGSETIQTESTQQQSLSVKVAQIITTAQTSHLACTDPLMNHDCTPKTRSLLRVKITCHKSGCE